MSADVRIEFIPEGFNQVINEPGVKALVDSTAADIARRAGEGFEAKSFRAGFGGSPRPAATVRAVTKDARVAQAVHKALSRAVMG